MSKFREDQDDEAILRHAQAQIDAEKPRANGEARKPFQHQVQFQDPDFDDPDVFVEQRWIHPYERRFKELRELEAKRDAILAKSEKTEQEERSLVVLKSLIEKAQKRFDEEKQRSLDDQWRLWRSRDEWRAGEGREEYNASRRERESPNADLSGFSEDEKKRRKQDMTNDSKWRRRLKDAGWSKDRIEAAYLVRVQEREDDRRKEAEAKAKADADERAERDALTTIPGFGAF